MKIRVITDELIVGDAVKIAFPRGTYVRGQEIEVDDDVAQFACAARWAEIVPDEPVMQMIPDPLPGGPIKAE